MNWVKSTDLSVFDLLQRLLRISSRYEIIIHMPITDRTDANLYQRRYMAKIRHQALRILGAKCARCGFTDERALQVDHVNGNGTADKKAMNGSYGLYKAIISGFTKPYQILCANCNWIKRHENGEHRKHAVVRLVNPFLPPRKSLIHCSRSIR
jgi:hypothetical protein